MPSAVGPQLHLPRCFSVFFCGNDKFGHHWSLRLVCSRKKRTHPSTHPPLPQREEFHTLILADRLPAELKPSRYAQRSHMVFLIFIL